MTLTLILIGIFLALGFGEKLGRVWTWITTEAKKRAREESQMGMDCYTWGGTDVGLVRFDLREYDVGSAQEQAFQEAAWREVEAIVTEES